MTWPWNWWAMTAWDRPPDSRWWIRGWRELLPILAPWLAREPRLVATAISNALFNLGQEPGADARGLDVWSLAELQADCPDVDYLAGRGPGSGLGVRPGSFQGRGPWKSGLVCPRVWPTRCSV